MRGGHTAKKEKAAQIGNEKKKQAGEEEEGERRVRNRQGWRGPACLEGPRSRKRPLLQGRTLMGLAEAELCSHCWSATQN